MLDPRQHAFRPDLADVRLRGRVEAAAFVEARPMMARAPLIPLHGRPDAGVARISELKFGELFDVFEDRDGWVWGQARADGYVGYGRSAGLGQAVTASHRIGLRRAFLYEAADVKSPVQGALTLGSPVAVAARDGAWCRLETGGWVAGAALEDLHTPHPDPVVTAEFLLGVPYLWGGRSADGLDCSGLVQLCLERAGRPCPRDSDQQLAALGRPITQADGLERGDIVGFPGHIGLMVNHRSLIHANATKACVSIDPLETVLGWVTGSGGGGIAGIRRP